jgi:AraC-like DNA-binding protein
LQRRIENAKYMLIHTTRGLTEIAYDCGFTSSSQFSKTFRKCTGLSPRAYRTTHR